MTIGHDANTTESVMTGTDDPHAFNHTPGTTLAGVWLTASHGVDATDHITKVTYGGFPMRRIDMAADTSTELGRSYLYFLGRSVPTGTQSVSIDTDATTTDIQFVCGGFTGSTNIELVDVAIAQEQVTNPSLTMAVNSRTSATVGVIYSGFADVTNLTINGNMTAIHSHDFGNFMCRVDKQTTPSSSDFTFSYTGGVEDTALVVAAFSEVVTPGIDHAAIVTAATRTGTEDPYDFTHTPLETLAGVWVMAHQEVSSTDHITGITYGGQAMTRIQSNVDTAGEPARTYIYFLGVGIPTGAQTVSVDTDGTTDDIRFFCGGFLGGAGGTGATEFIDSDGVSEQAAGASVTLTTVSGRRAASIGIIYSGLGNFLSAVLDPEMTVVFSSQITQGVLAVVLDPVPDASNFTVAFTGISDDVALSAAMFAETLAAPQPVTVAGTTTIGTPFVLSQTWGFDFLATESVRTGLEDPYTFSHTPAGQLIGVVLAITQQGASTDLITSVTYGGAAMTRIRTDVDTVSEPGRSYLYYLTGTIGTVPQGTQTVSVDLTSAVATDFHFVAQGFLGAKNMIVVDDDGVSEDVANPSLTLTSNGHVCATIGAYFSGTAAAANAVPNGNMTAIHDHEYGLQISRVDRQTTPDTGNFTFSYSGVGTEDVALSVAMFSPDPNALVLATTVPLTGTVPDEGDIVITGMSPDATVFAVTAPITASIAAPGIFIIEAAATVTATATVPAPTLIVIEQAVTVAATTTIAAPGIFIIEAGVTVAGTTTIGTAFVQPAQGATVAVTTTVGAPAVSGSAQVTGVNVAAVTTIGVVLLAKQPTTVAANVTIVQPSVTTGNPNALITGRDTVAGTTTIGAPAVSGTVLITPDNNLLTYDEATIEQSIGRWIPSGGTISATRSTDFAKSGSASLKAERISGAATDVDVYLSPRPAVVVGTRYTFSASFKSDNSTKNTGVLALWYNSGGTLVGQDNGNILAASASWQTSTVTAVAPATAATIRFNLYHNAAPIGDRIYWDEMSWVEGPSVTWHPPFTAVTTIPAPSPFVIEAAATVAATTTVGTPTFTSSATAVPATVSLPTTVGTPVPFVIEAATTVSATTTVGTPTITTTDPNALVPAITVACTTTMGFVSIYAGTLLTWETPTGGPEGASGGGSPVGASWSRRFDI